MMSTTNEVQELLSRGLQLPEEERELLALDLLESLDSQLTLETIRVSTP
jgi:hypothetical protein